ncbi:MAG: MBL fold metallo-hydrolase [Eubacteriaceae bacterium]|jgi:L-ascorbate metabolism protein UlaG (beta-lactamase superfamily)|nr:MBL fold metallo-hydrolase [Eubacteriaceae bacterium]
MDKIRLTWLGHSCFLASAEGYTIAFDPYSKGSVPGIDLYDPEANEVICSHEHGDHNYREGVKLIKGGVNPFKVTTIESFHDPEEGAQRGPNNITILEYKGIRVAHLGDIGCMPKEEQLEQLRGLDAVMIPVGGRFTLEALAAVELVVRIRPRVVIPMHFRDKKMGLPMISTPESFLIRMGDVVYHKENYIDISKETSPQTAMLKAKTGK